MRLTAFLLAFLFGQSLPFPGPGTPHTTGGGPFTCGNDVTAGSSSNPLSNIAIWTPCTTGANGPGYSVASVQIYVGPSAAGNVFSAIYSDTGTCGGPAHCPNSPICSDTTGVPAVANSFVIDTPAGCGTLAANTTYWVGQNADNALRDYQRQLSTCPAPLAFSSNSVFVVLTAGTWTGSIGPSTADAGACYLAFMVLTPL